VTGQAATGRLAAARVGQVGIWSGALASATAADARAAVGQMEALGYGAVWFGETPRLGREAFTHAGLLLAATHRMSVATGIANIWLRHPAAAAAAAHTLAEAYPGRFVLGLGASHAAALSLVGGTYDKPLSAMRTYLGQMAEATYLGPAPEHPVPVVVAALRHRMQELARDFADGMHSFFVDPPIPAPPARCSGRFRCWPPSRRSSSTPTPTAHGAEPASTSSPGWACRTTSTTCGPSATATRTSTAEAATPSSTA